VEGVADEADISGLRQIAVDSAEAVLRAAHPFPPAANPVRADRAARRLDVAVDHDAGWSFHFFGGRDRRHSIRLALLKLGLRIGIQPMMTGLRMPLKMSSKRVPGLARRRNSTSGFCSRDSPLLTLPM